MNKALLFFLLIFFTSAGRAQELRARVSVLSNRVGTSVDKKTFQTLQTALNNFVNNRKWSNDNFGPKEKIDCSFLLNLEGTGDVNVYKASLTIQSARPVFNTSYESPLINYQDNDVTFKYIEFQQLEFNDNRVSGTDALVSNLTAVFAYWINMILGFDYDSFSPRGGNSYFQKAQNIINNAPDGRNISGWKAFDGTRNRYWLAENLLNSRYNIIHDAIYNYYRMGLDKLYDNESSARVQILNVLSLLNTFNTENANTMILQFIMQGKSDELVKIFSKATPPDKARALDFLQKLDVSSASKYKDQLK
ncbi:MAG TPA: DUF4835 family protein [Hanamia sp.]|jgi:Domain of unknown function (DUF4835)|nr:DUF4835 family protein [Hanamia sp.]